MHYISSKVQYYKTKKFYFEITATFRVGVGYY